MCRNERSVQSSDTSYSSFSTLSNPCFLSLTFLHLLKIQPNIISKVFTIIDRSLRNQLEGFVLPLWMVTRFRREYSNIEFFYAKNYDDVVTVILYYVLFFVRINMTMTNRVRGYTELFLIGLTSYPNLAQLENSRIIVLDCNQSFSVFLFFFY